MFSKFSEGLPLSETFSLKTRPAFEPDAALVGDHNAVHVWRPWCGSRPATLMPFLSGDLDAVSRPATARRFDNTTVNNLETKNKLNFKW